MSLHFTLRVNGEEIGYFEARRTEARDVSVPSGADTVNVYEVTIGATDSHRQGVVEHRHGDGAWALVATAIDELGLGPK